MTDLERRLEKMNARLIEMIDQGAGDSEDADALRDEMDSVWGAVQREKSPIGELVYQLRDEHRLKRDYDYAIVSSCGVYRLLSSRAWADEITTKAAECGVSFRTVNCWEVNEPKR